MADKCADLLDTFVLDDEDGVVVAVGDVHAEAVVEGGFELLEPAVAQRDEKSCGKERVALGAFDEAAVGVFVGPAEHLLPEHLAFVVVDIAAAPPSSAITRQRRDPSVRRYR
ncbi:hypothetical protein [Streptomyces thermoalcalitolerans]|uniref:Uncharacterized protein n=1 Tax=Streptomyces thermoalcalitolerans TaxID=65605 RepID=A0ABN1NNR3_9ACTN